MRNLLSFVFVSLVLNVSAQDIDKLSSIDTLKFIDGRLLSVIGQLHNENNYNRLPSASESRVRPPVWDLSLNSAGIGIRFYTNASTIAVKWTVKNNASLTHMTAVGVKGVDLYAMVNNKWQFVNCGFPRSANKHDTAYLLRNGDGQPREFVLNLPLYDGVDSLSIGVNAGAILSSPKQPFLVQKPPVIYYGSSIAQGGVATRPGMAFTNILERHLDRSFINLGFSGNGTYDESVAEAIASKEAALYVIDCNPNTREDSIYTGALRVVRLLKAKRPNTPVLVVEAFPYDTDEFTNSKHAITTKKNSELKRAYNRLLQDGIKGLYYQKGDNLIGNDHEGTVDGVHPNDIGMMRMAQVLDPTIRSIIH